MTARRRVLFAWMCLGLAALCVPVIVTMPAHGRVFLVYNPSDSVRRGWYSIGPVASTGSLHAGSIVLARLPVGVAAFAAQRGHLPSGVPILKRIGAVAPQSLCAQERVLRVDGDIAATARTHDGMGRPLPAWQQCRRLAAGELFLLSDTNPASFDSRYFGPIVASDVIGVARPLWTWSAR